MGERHKRVSKVKVDERAACWARRPNISVGEAVVIERLMNLRQHQQNGKRSPHKPLLALLALARIDAVGSSAIPWVEAREQ